MTTRYFAGVDPGKHGAFAIVDGERVIRCEPNPYGEDGRVDVYAMREIIESGCGCSKCQASTALDECYPIVLEDVSCGFRRSGHWKLAESAHTWYAMLSLFTSGPPELLVARKWHSMIWGKPYNTKDKWDKGTSVDYCRRLYPDADLCRTPNCTADDDNMAEAILIAHAAWLLDGERRRAAELEGQRTTDA